MKNQTSISEQQLKTLLKERDVADFVPFAEVKQRLALLASLLGEFESPPSQGVFLLVAEEGKGKSWFPLNKDIVNIGRSKKADLPLLDDNISRFHCRIEKEDDLWEISDLDSKNGITINGKKCKQRVLCNGDLINIGIFNIYFISEK